MVLHFLSKEELLMAVENMQAKTTQNGVNVISTYLDSPPLNQDDEMSGYYSYLLPVGKLRELYEGWQIIYYDEKPTTRRFKSVRMIARKK